MALLIPQIARNDLGRVFVQNAVGEIGCQPQYLGCIGFSGLTIEKENPLTIRVPSTRQIGKYDTIERVSGVTGEAGFSMTSFVPLNTVSELKRLFNSDCAVNLHVHFGLCNDPTSFQQFSRSIVLENVMFNSYETDELIAQSAGDRAPITETVSGTADNIYEHIYNLHFSLVAAFPGTDPQNIYMISTDTCTGPCNFCNCLNEDCANDFLALDDAIIGVGINDPYIYTFNENGYVIQWNYDSLLQQLLQCQTLEPIVLEVGDLISTVEQIEGTKKVLIGTTDGKLYEYNLTTHTYTTVTTFAFAVTKISANDYGVLVGLSTGELYYSPTGKLFNAVGDIGSTISSLLLYSPKSWLVGSVNGIVYYTNNSGTNYIQSKLQYVTNVPVTKIVKSNDNILHAINAQRYYQSIDGGATWLPVNLSAYLSDITDVLVCATDELVIYVVGITSDLSQSCILRAEFGI